MRATLFATGIAAAAQVNRRPDYVAASHRFWDSLTRHKLYISGAAGAIEGDEKLGPDYFLPNDGYMETCAAVGVGFFAYDMNRLLGDAHYIDELERALYNAVLGGVELAGNRYYYQNPLSGEDSRRWEWHDCPCCPPMFLKIMGALPGYIYAQEPGSVYVNLFIGSRASLTVGDTKVALRQRTEYPWEGAVHLTVEPEQPAEFDLMVRIPGWAQEGGASGALYTPASRADKTGAMLSVNGKPVSVLEIVRGYARLRRTWKAGDTVEMSLQMPVRQIKAHPAVKADDGLVALMRGPILYCVESADNPAGVRPLVVSPKTRFTSEFKPELLGGVTIVRGMVSARAIKEGKTVTEKAQMTAIPFYASANRTPGTLRVWLPDRDDKAIPATLAARSSASASHCWHLDSAMAINDGKVPARSNDTSQKRLSWWDHKGTTEWASLTFPNAETVSWVGVFWFADRSVNGGCDAPESWRLLYKAGAEWKPVESPSGYGVALDRFNEVTFTPVRTDALRVEVKLQAGWSGGICEWQVE